MSTPPALPSTNPSSPELVWQAARHLPQLDGVRGLAILLVTLYRFGTQLPAESGLGRALATAFRFGDRGVDLFFVLSGFLITGVLIQARGQKHYFRNFFARRSLRIFPLYFVSLAGLLGLASQLPSLRPAFEEALENQVYLWTYLTNWKMAWEGRWCFGALDHFWSLAVEEHFYLIWPLILFAFTLRWSLRLAVGLAGVCAVSRVAFVLLGDNDVAADVLSVFRFDALLLGAAIALWIRAVAEPAKFRGGAFFFVTLCLMFGIGLGVFHLRAFTVTHSLWAGLWSGMLVYLLVSPTQSWVACFFNQGWLRWLGKYSYAMYVFQSPLIPISASIVSVATLQAWLGNLTLAVALYIPIMFFLTCAAAFASWHLLEKHMLRLKKFFPATEAGPEPPQNLNK